MAPRKPKTIVPSEVATRFDYGFNKPTRSEAKKIKAAEKLPEIQALKKKRSYHTKDLPIRYRNDIPGLVSEIQKNPYKLDALLKSNEYVTLQIEGQDKEGHKYNYKSGQTFGNFSQLAKFLSKYQADKHGKRKSKRSQKKLIDSIKIVRFQGDPDQLRFEVNQAALVRSQARQAAKEKRRIHEAAEKERVQKRLVKTEERIANVERRSIVGQLRQEALKQQVKEQKKKATEIAKKRVTEARKKAAEIAKKKVAKESEKFKKRLAAANKEIAALKAKLAIQGKKKSTSGGKRK
jgi:hypothetical protein